jgi:hypothetical protein
MTQANLERVRYLRRQIISETKHGFADWNLVQKHLDELMAHHHQYKLFAEKENIHLYSQSNPT